MQFAEHKSDDDIPVWESTTPADPPIAPRQEAWEVFFGIIQCKFLDANGGMTPDEETMLDILRAEHHAEAWDRLEPYPHERADNSVAWRRRAEELRR